jgi:hypothetical protein
VDRPVLIDADEGTETLPEGRRTVTAWPTSLPAIRDRQRPDDVDRAIHSVLRRRARNGQPEPADNRDASLMSGCDPSELQTL